ncbi:pyridoxamine 5'-phosphate oxidase family protein [Tumebacillus algifaecis]|uniref:pyridoxamine 5'-phosphate oxidase family protein n=1 Tax=Tumebacillus algifaecis TaxID=1214604 RepID=UPI001D131A45|nr:pyridoxamine 5'-phosphate oxidase family protein [Tumebacillus algifaecis]
MIVLNFPNRLTDAAELHALLGEPNVLVANKVIDHLDAHCLEFLAQSPFVVLSTADASGLCDVSPRGDQPGFVTVLDAKRLLIPERPGNKRVDSLRNILSNPHIGLLFLIPGLEETLRINGRACIVRDEALLSGMAVQDRVPQLAIGVEVEECFVHCAKAFKRSQLWNPSTWADKASLPSPAKMLAAHVKLPNIGEAEINAALQESYTKRLY